VHPAPAAHVHPAHVHPAHVHPAHVHPSAAHVHPAHVPSSADGGEISAEFYHRERGMRRVERHLHHHLLTRGGLLALETALCSRRHLHTPLR
jgi:hypothetical protein